MLKFEDFSEEIYEPRKIICYKNQDQYGKYHFYDEDGLEIFTKDYYGVDKFGNNFYKVKDKDGLYGVINIYGDEIVPCKYDNIMRRTNISIIVCVDSDGVLDYVNLSTIPIKKNQLAGIKYISKINVFGNTYEVSAEDPAGITRKKIELLECLRGLILDFEEEALALETDMMSEDYEDRLNRGL